MTRWQQLLNPEVVRGLVALREQSGREAEYLSAGPVVLKVTSHQATYSIPRYLVEHFEAAGVSFSVTS